MYKYAKLRSVLFLIWLATLIVAPARAEAAVRVVASIAPIHSLVAAVMEGVAQPQLLVEAGASVHSYQLKPSQMRQLHHADLVVWVGESVESFLPRTLASLPDDVAVVELMTQPGMVLLPARRGGMWEEGGHEAGPDHHHGDIDGHLWLDPVNAQRIVQAVAKRLARLDPDHAQRYRRNSEALVGRLNDLDGELRRRLAPVRNVPYLVYHDAFHYFEARYELNASGSITVDPGRKPGARRLRQIRQRVEVLGVHCVFREPQFPASVTRVVSEGSGLTTAVLDPLGVGLEPGPALYFQLMRQLADGLIDCLQASP